MIGWTQSLLHPRRSFSLFIIFFSLHSSLSNVAVSSSFSAMSPNAPAGLQPNLFQYLPSISDSFNFSNPHFLSSLADGRASFSATTTNPKCRFDNLTHNYNLVASGPSSLSCLSIFGEFYGFPFQDLFLWQRGEGIDVEESRQYKEKATAYILTCAKLKPREGVAFRFLWLSCDQVLVDPQRASKCYRRTVTLNLNDSEATVSELEFPIKEIELKLAPSGGSHFKSLLLLLLLLFFFLPSRRAMWFVGWKRFWRLLCLRRHLGSPRELFGCTGDDDVCMSLYVLLESKISYFIEQLS